ncbi:MAG: pentapeptide repeat-containing protein [Myxococcales bacterium]|nr:pentapeptide repeat-containing protein [Myxococcales bacterium]
MPALTPIINALSRQLDRQLYKAHTSWLKAGGKGPGRLVVEGQTLLGFHASAMDLRGAMFTDCTLSKGNLTHTDLSHARLLGCDLSKVDLHFTKFAKATIIGCTFEGSRLSLATLADAKVIGCNLRDLNASRILIANTDVKRCDFDAALVDASFEGSRFQNCSFRDSIISRKASGGRLGRAIGCTFHVCDFRDVDFTDFQISECRFDRCLFHGVKGAPALGEDVLIHGADLSVAGDGSTILDPEKFLERWRDGALGDR